MTLYDYQHKPWMNQKANGHRGKVIRQHNTKASETETMTEIDDD